MKSVLQVFVHGTPGSRALGNDEPHTGVGKTSGTPTTTAFYGASNQLCACFERFTRRSPLLDFI